MGKYIEEAIDAFNQKFRLAIFKKLKAKRKVDPCLIKVAILSPEES